MNYPRYVSTNLQKRTKTVTLTIKRDNLLYSIKNPAYVEGDVMKTDDEHQRHQVIDIAETGNYDRVTEMLDIAYAECVHAMYPYTKEDVETGMEVDDDPSTTMEAEEAEGSESTDYVINLLVPDEYAKSSINLILRYVHEYMVCRVLADWLSITKPEAAENWQEKAEWTLRKVREAVNFRTGRVRRTQTPF